MTTAPKPDSHRGEDPPSRVEESSGGAALVSTPAPSKTRANDLAGLVDLYGYHPNTKGWFLSGWIRNFEQLDEQPRSLVATFDDESQVVDYDYLLLFPRSDVPEEACGFLVFLQAEACIPASLLHLTVESGTGSTQITLAQSVKPLSLVKLELRLRFIISHGKDGRALSEMTRRVSGAPGPPVTGFIEAYGHCAAAGGWFIIGWISHPWSNSQRPSDMLLSFEDGHDVRGDTIAALFPRAGLPDGAQGMIFFVASGQAAPNPLCSMSWRSGISRSVNGRRERRRVWAMLVPIEAAPRLEGDHLTALVRATLTLARPNMETESLSNLLDRGTFTGEDTLETLAPNIFLYLDRAVVCEPEGLLLIGWMLAKPNEVRQMRLCSGERITVFEMKDAIRIDRKDVLKEFEQHGFEDNPCGFMIYLPQAVEPGNKAYIEIETQRCAIAYRNVSLSERNDLQIIRQLLGYGEFRFEDLRLAYDRVFGPAVEAMNAARLAFQPPPQIIEYGQRPVQPKYSIIVTLYKRVDFVEYQLALFSVRPQYFNVEFIYVLDDPQMRVEAQRLFSSVHERFMIPFRAIFLEQNVGFGPANNIGLANARGDYVAYLNSDVFPGTENWLDQLSVHLEADPALGAIGPLLLFEDGSIQHRGMYYERLPEFANWYFCKHHEKGTRDFSLTGLTKFLSITGACIVMRRDLAVQVGGFDEKYLIGDFEDSDLCLKLAKLGYDVAIDPAVALFHLERQSQVTSAQAWRHNITLYNAWQHDKSWATMITERQHADSITLN